MEAGGAAFGALDATVQTADNQPPDNPVEVARADLAQAVDTVERLTSKRDKAAAALDDAEQALIEAEDVVEDRKADLAEAEKTQKASD